MRKKVKSKKTTVSITLDADLLVIVNETFSNRSKFLQKCIVEELCKNDEIKELLKKLKMIL
jgi:5'-3' exonuclease